MEKGNMFMVLLVALLIFPSRCARDGNNRG